MALVTSFPASSIQDVLFYLSLQSLVLIFSEGVDNQRNSAIVLASRNCTDSVSILQSYTNDELAGVLLTQLVLVRSGLLSPGELSNTSSDTQRNTLISANHKHTNISIPKLQALSTLENCRLAYAWVIPQLAPSFLLSMASVQQGDPMAFQVQTSLPSGAVVSTDCLSIVAFSEGYVGVFHSLAQGETFNLYAAMSIDLVHWNTTSLVMTSASMGKVYYGEDIPFSGLLLLFESNRGSAGPSVAFAYYSSPEQLLNGSQPEALLITQRSLSEFAEGTPSLISSVRVAPGNSLSSFDLEVGFHYFEDGRIDQQAYGNLHNFSQWTTAPAYLSNLWMQENGVTGKVGSRQSFLYQSARWFVVEAQLTLNDWASWRVFLGDGIGISEHLIAHTLLRHLVC